MYAHVIKFTTNDISCAIGIASLERLDETIKQRNKWVENFIPRLSETKTCFPYNFNNNFSVFYFPIFVDVDNISCSKRDFAEALIAEGVGLQPHYGCVVSDWEWAKDYMDDYIVAVNATEIRDNSFNLFVNEKYGDKEIDDIIESIKKVESHFIKDKNKKGFIVESAPVR